MADNSNYSMMESAGTLGGTEILPSQSVSTGKNSRTTVDAIATYVAGAGKALTGSFSGTITGVTSEVFTPTEKTASATMPATSFLQLNHATVPIAITALTPTVGQFLVITQNGTGTAGHTVTTAGTFDGTNNTATFNAQHETLVLFGLSSTRWAIIQNIGSVGLSAV